MSTVTLAEAKTHLNITGSTSDAELQDFIDRAEAAVETRCGPLVSSATTQRVRGQGCRALTLDIYPIISLTSVTPVGGSALTLADLSAEDGGIIEWVGGTGTFDAARYVVVYQAGHAATAASLPADLKYGVLELVRHFWDSQRRGRGPADQSQPGPSPSPAFRRAWDLLEPFMLATL